MLLTEAVDTFTNIEWRAFLCNHVHLRLWNTFIEAHCPFLKQQNNEIRDQQDSRFQFGVSIRSPLPSSLLWIPIQVPRV
jgi:hypothetical protein